MWWNRTTQPIRNNAAASTYPSARYPHTALMPRRDNRPDPVSAAAPRVLDASPARPATMAGRTSSPGRSANETSIAVSPAGSETVWLTMMLANTSPAAIANHR